MQITAIVPQLPPAIDGVGDYALRLASQLQQDFGLSSRFIVGNPDWQNTPAIAPFPAQAVSLRTSADLIAQLEQFVMPDSKLLLHYVPHGYATKACPFWLVQGLETWRKRFPQIRFLTFFHELYALDWHRPWSSDFWLSPVQQHLTSRLAQLSDACLTSTERYIHPIRRLSQGKQGKIPTLPIFSNVGELADVQPLTQRQRHLIIFGQRHSKRRIYQASLLLLKQVCQALAIETILDIGPSSGITPVHVNGVPLQELGKRPLNEISAILAQAFAGFLNYDPRRLSKSGIFAAYSAHGLLPINHRGFIQSVDGLTTGTHYWVPPTTPTLDIQKAQAIATAAYTWYQAHNLAAQTEKFHRYLKETNEAA